MRSMEKTHDRREQRRSMHGPALLRMVRERLGGREGFSIIELLVVMLIASIISVAVLAILSGTTNVFNSQNVRMLNQDDARTAINQMARYVRSATSSADNMTTQSNAIATALPQDIEFYCDVDGDGVAEKVRYYLDDNVLMSQTEEPEWIEATEPYWEYGEYDTDGIVIENRVRNGTEGLFVYYRYNIVSGALEECSPTTAAGRQEIVTVGIMIKVGERPDLAAKDVVLATDVQIRQRYEGELQ
jgi:prepilin-type N-terminal cleavage/methylation domain-containing protein